MIQQYLFLSVLTVMVGALSFDLIVNAIDAQVSMQLQQLENLK